MIHQTCEIPKLPFEAIRIDRSKRSGSPVLVQGSASEDRALVRQDFGRYQRLSIAKLRRLYRLALRRGISAAGGMLEQNFRAAGKGTADPQLIDHLRKGQSMTLRPYSFATAFIAFLAFGTSASIPAESIRLREPAAGASLHAGEMDMSVYFLDRGDHFEVIATYARHQGPYDPARLRMGLIHAATSSNGRFSRRATAWRFSLTPHFLYCERAQRNSKISAVG